MIWLLGIFIAAIALPAALIAVRDRGRGTPRDPAASSINLRTGEWMEPGSGSLPGHGHGHGHGAGHAGGGGHVGGHGG